MSEVLEEWNRADAGSATEAMLACCAARRWAAGMIGLRPIPNIAALSEAADRVWAEMTEPDWLEAFAAHPKIGERNTVAAQGRPAAWSQEEQAAAGNASQELRRTLAGANEAYERSFGFTYIVCATGKSAEAMLAILERRLANDRSAELREAAEQQRQIMQIRLGKWLLS